MPSPSVASHVHDTSTRQTPTRNVITGDAGAGSTREAGAFLSYLLDRLEPGGGSSLPAASAFLHIDTALHNVVWPRWLACLRPNLSEPLVSLSPAIVPHYSPSLSRASLLLGQLRGAAAARNLTRKRGAPPCCFLWVQPRAALESFGRSRIQSAADSLKRAGGLGGLNPWDFELHYHRAFDASAGEVALEVASARDQPEISPRSARDQPEIGREVGCPPVARPVRRFPVRAGAASRHISPYLPLSSTHPSSASRPSARQSTSA